MITADSLRSAAGWNELLASRRRNRIVGMTRWTRRRESHPWRTRVQWDAAAEQWQATVKPGLVNGRNVTTLIEGEDVKLTDRPAIPLTSWRKLGEDGDAIAQSVSEEGAVTLGFEPVPDFFLARGVKSKASITISPDDPSGLLALLSEDSAPRRLRAMDIVLHHDRPGLVSTELGTGLSVGIRTAPGARKHAYLRATRRFEGNDAPPDPLQQLAGNWTDSTRDSELVCTVFMLSPEDASEDEPVDETWTPFVRHELFYNLSYSHNDAVLANFQPLTFQTNLAGGVADPLIQSMLDANNDAARQVLDFLTTNRIEGRFWTI